MGRQLKLYQEILQGARDKDLILYFIDLSLLRTFYSENLCQEIDMHFDSFYSDNLGMPNGLALAS